MKSYKLHTCLLILGIALCFPGCRDQEDDYAITIDTVADGMHLAVNAEEVVLSQDLMDETAVTFTWGEAQPRANHGVITYYFKLGLPGFTSAIEKIKIDPGVFTYSLSHGDLNVLVHSVGIPYGDAAQLEAEIIAWSEEGEFFVKPEISTVTFNVTTYSNNVPVPATLYLVGSANPAGSEPSNAITLDNGRTSGEFLWAGQLQAGSFKFINAIAGDEQVSSWSKGAGDSELVGNYDAGASDLEFTITAPGLYSIYIDMNANEIIYGVKRWRGIWGMGPGAGNPNWEIPSNAELSYDYRRPGVFTLEVVAEEYQLFNFIYDSQENGWGSPFITAPSSWHNMWDTNNIVLNLSGNGDGNSWAFNSYFGHLGPGVLTIDANAETITWELK